MIPAHISLERVLCSLFTWWGEGKNLTWFAATVQLTWLVQLTEMSGTSNPGYSVCLLWKGGLNGSLVTNFTWKLTSIYSHFLSSVLHPCLLPVLVSSVCVSPSRTLLDFYRVNAAERQECLHSAVKRGAYLILLCICVRACAHVSVCLDFII